MVTGLHDGVVAVTGAAGPEMALPVKALTDTIVAARGGMLATIVGVLVMVHFSSGVFMQLRSALNRIWQVTPRGGLRGALQEQLVSLVFVPSAVLAGMAVMLLGLVSPVIGPVLEEALPGSSWVWDAGSSVLPFLLLAALLTFLYRQGPGTGVAWRDVWIGAGLTAAIFTAGNAVLGWAIGRSMVVSFYGAAGALVVVLLWVFYSAHLLLFGACVTRAYADQLGSRARAVEGGA